jgi:hypothetical protein
MIAFLPPLHPDELLYSLLARVHLLTCIESPKRNLDELFRNRHVRAGVALQANMASLCTNLPPQRKMSPEILIKDATLFPYLTAFQPPEIQQWALSLLTEGNAGAVSVRLGLVAGAVQLPACLRYCPSCRKEMLITFGELYWMRAHQLPGLLICSLHGVPLADSTVRPAAANQHKYIAAEESNCPSDPPLPAWVSNRDAIRLLSDIAQASVAILTDPPPAHSLESWGVSYRSALVMRGFGKGHSNVNQEYLLNAYRVHFGPIFSLLPEAAPDLWLKGMTRKQRKSVAPLRHLLLRLLLDAMPLFKPLQSFRSGPWLCRNPLADHRGQPVVANCRTHKEGGKAIDVFSCSCGYIFSQSTEPGSNIRILDLGPLFEVRLRELVTTGTSLRTTARTLGVDPNTVRRYVSKFGLITPWKPRPPHPKLPAPDRDSIRTSWSVAHLNAPSMSRKQLRSKFPAAYAWLYRHDHEWLASQPPLPMHAHGGKQRRDWSMIDMTIAAELRERAAQLRADIPPIAVTRAALQRILGKPDWLDRRLNKLPFCAAEFDELMEPVEAFQCRRIAWAVDELHRLDKSVIAWRLRRMAGLPDHCSSQVEAVLSAAEERAS